jgi:cell division transport system ATP-binding protein
MLYFNEVTKMYKQSSQPALHKVSFKVERGEFVFIVGPSGSGKSTILKTLLAEERVTSGDVAVLGKHVSKLRSGQVQQYRQQLGSVFQDFKLLPNKTVYDNVAFSLEVIGKNRAYIRSTVPDVLTTVGLAMKADKMPHELSGGEQQRVAIARAVVNKPFLVLADEPTGNLDPQTSKGIMSVLERINSMGATVIMATHDVSIVDGYRKRVIEMHKGEIVRDDSESTYTESVRSVTVGV